MFDEFYRRTGLKLRGLWFAFFLALSRLVSRFMRVRTFFHFVKLLPYHAKFVSDEIIQCKVPDGLMLTYLESSSSPEAVDLRKYYKFYRAKQGDVILDVGAHVGSFTIRTSRKIGNGLIISFEPNPKSYKLLRMNLMLNELKNVIPHNVALADFEGTSELRISEDLADSFLTHSKGKKTDTYVVGSNPNSVTVRVRRIDDICNEMELKKVDFVKIHAEGSELDILKGARNTLIRNDINLAITSSRFSYQSILKEVCDYLSVNGFKVVINGVILSEHPTLYCFKQFRSRV